MRTLRFFVVCSVVLTAVLLMRVTNFASTETPDPHDATESGGKALCGGEPCGAVVRGALAFFDRRLRGLEANGRACADCHIATDHFQLSPASVEARFQLLQWRRRWNPNADDPLFRPIDADDFRTNGEHASDFSNLRQNGLVRISFPLPTFVRLIDPATNTTSSETFVDVWRAVPSVNDVALTGPDGTNPWARGPNATGGYQLDARVATLQEQALGALTNHAKIQHAPPQRLLDDLASFQRVLFTNDRVRALSEAITAGAVPLPIRIHHSTRSSSRGRPCSSAPAPTVTPGRGSQAARRALRCDTTISAHSAHGRSMRSRHPGGSSNRAHRAWLATHGSTRSS